MTKRQFEQILKSGEGAMVEFKKTVSSSLGREICAFANTIGGQILIGIDDRVEISNPGELLVDEKEFGKKTISVARNPVLFDIFHRLQLIEKVGTGVQRIIDAIQARKLSIEFYFGSFFSITFFRPDTRSPAPSRHQVGTKLALSEQHVSKILEYCLESKAIADIMALFDRKDRTKFKEKFINHDITK